MKNKILSFIKELKETTGCSFVYEVTYWEFEHLEDTQCKHSIGSSLQGFDRVNKDTQEELIETFDLIRDKVSLLLRAKEVTKQIETKLLNFSEG